MNKIADEQILEMLADESQFDRAFEHLVVKYQEQLYWHIRRIVHIHEDADDVIQNTFIKVFRYIKSFNGKSKLYTWLYRIASNEAISYLNKKNKSKSTSLEDMLVDLETRLNADQHFNGDHAQLCLLKAIETLPEKQKLVFNMRYFEEMSYKDIAEILEVSTGSLKASFHHAMKKVEDYLKQNVDYV